VLAPVLFNVLASVQPSIGNFNCSGTGSPDRSTMQTCTPSTSQRMS